MPIEKIGNSVIISQVLDSGSRDDVISSYCLIVISSYSHMVISSYRHMVTSPWGPLLVSRDHGGGLEHRAWHLHTICPNCQAEDGGAIGDVSSTAVRGWR